MNYRLFFTFFVIVFSAHVGYGQIDYESKFKNGKALFTQGKYALAMEVLKNSTKADQFNNYTKYASYYYALSAYRLGHTELAKNMLLQLDSRYPKWENSKEVDYWLAHIYFENGEYDFALDRTASSNSDLGIDQMKIRFLKEIQSVDSLQWILEKHPYDKSVAQVLASKISIQPVLNRNQDLLDFLISEFDLDETSLASLSMMKTKMKDKYKVSALFPFMIKTLSPSRNKNKRPFVLDIYEGMRIAADSLRREKIVEIDLRSFDTDKDSTVTKNILSSAEFAGTDLIVGPLFTQTNKVVSEYSFKNKVNMVNPLSTNSKVIGANPFSFLFMPSAETYARKVADFVKQDIENKNAVIFYSPRDSIYAHHYKRAIEEDSFKVVVMEPLEVEDTGKILKILTKKNGNEELIIQPDSIGHVFIASSKELVITNAISAIDTRRDMIPLFINESMLNYRSVSYSQLERLKIRIVASKYIDAQRRDANNFMNEYSKVNGELPSQNVCLGYELMYFFGTQLKEHGTLFQLGFSEENIYKSELMGGVKYFKSNDNNYVQILNFKDAILRTIEPGEINESEESQE